MPKAVAAALLSLSLLLAACAGAGSDDAVSDFTATGRPIGAAPDYVDVEASYRSSYHQVEKIELVAPDGTRYPASDIDTVVEQSADRGPHYGGVGVHGGSGGFSGVGVGLSLGWLLGGVGSREPVVHARATIPVPDPAAYRQNWQDWRIAVTLSRGGTERREFTAPAPAPAG